MSIRFITYKITDTVAEKPAQKRFFNYGTLCFKYTIFGVAGTYYGPTHWLNQPVGILFAESDQADDYQPQLKLGYSAVITRYAPPIDITSSIQAGIYIGNLIKANPELLALLAG